MCLLLGSPTTLLTHIHITVVVMGMQVLLLEAIMVQVSTHHLHRHRIEEELTGLLLIRITLEEVRNFIFHFIIDFLTSYFKK